MLHGSMFLRPNVSVYHSCRILCFNQHNVLASMAGRWKFPFEMMPFLGTCQFSGVYIYE